MAVKSINDFVSVYTCTDYTFSSEKAEKEIGFHPKYSLETALGNTITFYKKQD